jgi:hypothetical protein
MFFKKTIFLTVASFHLRQPFGREEKKKRASFHYFHFTGENN